MTVVSSHHGRGIALWAAAAAMIAATAALYLAPSYREHDQAPQHTELQSTIDKASTYYEFGHYERAVETYREAIDRGMTDAIQWYRYAQSIELSGNVDLGAYAHAYRLLLEQNPTSDECATAQGVLERSAIPFDYAAAQAGAIRTGQLVTFTGTIGRVIWGRVEADSDQVYVSTRPDRWFGHMGEDVRVETPRFKRFRAGDAISVIGWYGGYTTVNDDAGLFVDYPTVRAVGAITIQ